VSARAASFLRGAAPQLGVAATAGFASGVFLLISHGPARAFWGGSCEGFGALFLQLPAALLTGLLLVLVPPLRRLPPRRQVALSWALGLAGAGWPFLAGPAGRLVGSRGGAMALALLLALGAGLVAGHLLRDRSLAGPRSGLLAALLLGLVPIATMHLLGGPKLPPLPPGSPPSTAPPPADAPCVLLVSVDTLRADRVGAVRDGLPLTPVLDALAASGQHGAVESPSNQTVPGHVSLLTAVPALRHGTYNNRQILPGALATLAEVFFRAGWRTGGVISNPLLRGNYGFARGFEIYDDAAVQGDTRVQAVNLLRWRSPRWSFLWSHNLLAAPVTWLAGYELFRAMERGEITAGRAGGILDRLQDPERPFFLFAHFMDPHSPYRAPGQWAGAFSTPEERQRMNAFGTRGFMVAVRHLEDRLMAGDPAAEEDLDILGRLYDEEVRYVDHCIGQLLEAAREVAGDRPLWVVVTADHGEHFGEHRWRGGRPLEHARTLLEPETRVPLVVAGWTPEPWPRSLDEVGLSLARAALGRAAGPLAAGLPPRPVPVVQGFQEGRRRYEFAIREEGWKLILEADDLEEEPRPLALFSLEQDPGEARDLLEAEPDRARALLARFLELRRKMPPVPREAWESGPDAKLLADLGYAGE